MTEHFLIAAAVVSFVYALLARRIGDGVITGPMVFLALGTAAAWLGAVHLEHAEGALHILAEITLVIVLFTDAATIDLSSLRKQYVWPGRMLLAGLPLAMLFGTGVGMLLLSDWPIWEVALLAAILAPTDAALGQAVITNPAVPARVRQALGVESGVNDGLALPAVLFFGCIAVGGVHDNVQSNWLLYALEQIGLGTLAGVVVGALGAVARDFARRRQLSSEPFEGIAVLALAGLCYLAAVAVGGNGFLAAFVGGLAFGASSRQPCHFVLEFMETEGQLLILGTFLLLGAALVPQALGHAQPAWLVLILLSLFVVRPAAIWLSLWRTDAAPLAKGFMGWFGPRGLATALFALLVVGQLDRLKHGEDILSIAVLAVLLSALLHGVSAAPGARWFARRLGDCHQTPAAGD